VETLYKMLTYAIYGVWALFAWDTVSCILNFISNPERYAVQSAPWYTEILVSAVYALVLTGGLLLVRRLVKSKL
jgi:hypothetical protein